MELKLIPKVRVDNMDLHDFKDVAENYDLYVDALIGNSSFNTTTCIEFHRELAKQWGEKGIVDLGCGTGLVLIPLLEDGHCVYAIDISQEMINVTKSKVEDLFKDRRGSYNLICSDMKNFSLDRQVSLIIIPRSGFIHLLGSVDQIDALKNINSNLTMGGVLSLNTFFPSYEVIVQNGKGKVKKPFLRNSFVGINGNMIEIYNLIEYDYETQIMEGKWIFKELGKDGKVINSIDRPIKMRWTFKSEMELLFELCGFEVIEIYGGYDKSQACYPSHIIWVVKKVRSL